MFALRFDEDRKEVYNPEALALLLDVLDDHATGVRRIFNVTIDGKDVFYGNAEQPLSGGSAQYLAFRISPESIGYRVIKTKRSDSWRDDATGKSKSKRAGMKLKCREGNVQCGGKCQPDAYGCNVDPTVGQKNRIRIAAELVKKEKGGLDRIKSKNEPNKGQIARKEKLTVKLAAQKERNQKQPEKGGEIDPISKPKSKQKKTADPKASQSQPKNNGKIAKEATKKGISGPPIVGQALKRHLQDLGYDNDLKRDLHAARIEALGSSQTDRFIRKAYIQPFSSVDRKNGWIDRIEALRSISRQPRLSKRDLQTAALYANEQGLFRSNTPAGEASRRLMEDIYTKTTSSGKKIIENKLGRSYEANHGVTENKFVATLNRNKKQNEARSPIALDFL